MECGKIRKSGVQLYNLTMAIALPVITQGTMRPVYAQGPRSLSALKLLRISVTDRCNLRCMYCMPQQGVDFAPKSDTLSPDEIISVARAAVDVGLRNHVCARNSTQSESNAGLSLGTGGGRT